MKFLIESAGKVASRVTLGTHELVFDQPAAVPSGEDRGPSPLDVMAAAIGACAHYFAAAFLVARGSPVDDLRVEVNAEKSRDPQPRLGKVSIRVVLPPGLPTSYLPRIEQAVRNCPAYGTLVQSPDVELTFVQSDVQAPAA